MNGIVHSKFGISASLLLSITLFFILYKSVDSLIELLLQNLNAATGIVSSFTWLVVRPEALSADNDLKKKPVRPVKGKLPSYHLVSFFSVIVRHNKSDSVP